MKRINLYQYIAISILAVSFFCPLVEAKEKGSDPFNLGGLTPNKGGGSPKSLEQALAQDVDATADSLGFIGSNIIAKGNVFIKYQDMLIRADEAIINISTKDIEAIGNISFTKMTATSSVVTLSEFSEFRAQPNKRVRIDGYDTDPTGLQKLKITTIMDALAYKGNKVVGNLGSGILEFKGFACHTDKYYCSGEYATRGTDGKITIKNAKLSTCEYMEDNHEHYSINVGTVHIYPPSDAPKDLFKYKVDMGDHSMWAYNCTMEVAGIPVFWMPAMYKPTDETWGFFQVRAGKDSDWGYFLLISKKFNILDYPNTTTKFMLDFYSGRGIAVGNETQVRTETSETNLFVYGLRDAHPYGLSNKDDEDAIADSRRLDIPKNRYDLRLNDVTHITPRLDFRGQIEKLSDVNFLKDYFNDRYQTDPQPATFASLEYQFDRFSAGLLVRPKINDFNTETQRLPEFRVDIPRQELWNNIYYQGQNSIDYFKTSWRKYDKDRTTGNLIDPANYDSGRLDSLHVLYYPVTLDWLNLIPRAGMRFTGYTKTSRNEVTEDDLGNMFALDSPDATTTSPDVDINNYDPKNSANGRFVGELGLEANTKIYRSWQNAKNAFWQLDGLRHVMVPYTNYVFIPDPSLKSDKILYYDDIDRLTKENFVRLGLQNRLQTRRGTYGAETIYNWMTLENYIDYHFISQKGFKNLGDFGTLYKFNPMEKLTLSSLLLLDAGQSNPHDTPTSRAGEAVMPQAGLHGKWIDKWENSINYELMKDFKVYASYIYQDAYKQRSTYSMGSTLSEIDSTSGFLRNYTGRNQTTNFGTDFPIPIDEKTFGGFSVLYDFEEGYIREIQAKVKRKLHCWEAAIEAAQSVDRDYYLSKRTKNSIMLAFYLTAAPSVKIKQRQSMGGSGGGDNGGGGQ